ncbi:auxin-induced protein 15A-like [Cannabis sativa]|uniref:auxin-induced protein 15A-like n=1 Tax=Cannabis sativa TaxID=3483 RepID=UPI0029CA0FA7|nr:auxin-induced protein 15A-like [Cannabis sativa]
MGFYLPGVVTTKKFLRRSLSSNSSKTTSSAVDVPKGHLAVYVGERQKKRFVIPVSILSHSLFQELLVQAEDEYGYDHPMGGLTIPCREDMFVDLISNLNAS